MLNGYERKSYNKGGGEVKEAVGLPAALGAFVCGESSYVLHKCYVNLL